MVFGKLFGGEKPASGGRPTEVTIVRPRPVPAPEGSRASSPAPTAAPARQQLPAAPTPAAAPAARAAASYNTLGELQAAYPQWTGDWLSGVVSSEVQDKLAVLWLGVGDVVMAGTAEQIGGAHAAAVRSRLVSELHLVVHKDIVVGAGVIAQMRDTAFNSTRSSKKAAIGGMVTPDNYHLRVYNELIAAAIAAKASDIHISLRKEDQTSAIALRMHGRFRPWRHDLHEKLVWGTLRAAFGQKIIEGTNSRSDLGYDNEIAFMTKNEGPNGSIWNGRANGRPDLRGFKMVIRLLESNPQPETIPTLDELGYVSSHQKILETCVRRNYGVIIIFGSTGSGKSTTLRTFIVKVTDPQSQAVFSVESPVEYEMPGVTQISIPVDVTLDSEEIAAKFTAALRDVMRMDPDVLMVGEIRDHESGKLVSEFTQSGHRCYSTSHGDGCVDGLQRLAGEQIGMPAELFGGAKFLSASIYQRLLPKLCKECRVPATDPDRGLPAAKLQLLRSKFDIDPGTMFVANPQGCPACKPRIPGMVANGRYGVTVAAEVLVPNAKMRELAAKRDWTGLYREWRMSRTHKFGESDMNGKTAFENALYLAITGRVALDDIESEFEPIETYEVYPMRGEGGRSS